MQSLHYTRAVRVRLQASNVWAAPPGRVQPRPNRAYHTAHAHHRGEIRPESRPKPSRVWQGPLRVGWAESASPIRPDIPGCLSRNAAAGGLPSSRFQILREEGIRAGINANRRLYSRRTCPFIPAGLSLYSRRAVLLFPQGWRSSPGRHLAPARPAPTAMAGIRAARHAGPRR